MTRNVLRSAGLALSSEVEQILKAPRQLLPIAIAIALMFAVGIAVKEIVDSRIAGALAALLTIATFALIDLLRTVREHPERITPIIFSIGAGWLAAAAIVTGKGEPGLAVVFLLIGTVAVLYARRRSRAR